MEKGLVKMAVCLLLTTAIFFSVSGCGSQIQNESLMEESMSAGKSEEIQSDKERGETSEETLVLAVTKFGVRLLQCSMEKTWNQFPPYASMPQEVYASIADGGNMLISPLSVISVLAMAANGAEGETLRQMEEIFGIPIQTLSTYLSEYQKSFPEDDKYRLNMANAVWLTEDERFTVKEEFLETNEALFKAGLYRAPFDDSTRKEINDWVRLNTDGVIEEILDSIHPDAIMYLVNALAFDAEWQEIYYDYQVREGEFTRADGTIQKVEMMYSSEGWYLEGEHAKGFLKYYADGKYAFAALLPEEGMTAAEYAASLTGEELRRILTNPVEAEVQAAIPKFESEYGIEMSEILREMGMEDAFDEDRADFSGIGYSTQGNIYIGRVLHKTFIAVDDRGTKAGAATAIEMRDGGGMPVDMVKTVYLDRPFLYMIIDSETAIPIFIGMAAYIEG